ncbi:hypothetical protein HanXRQr2_Chr08g0319161 [Helianthus annuus]|uniref:Uncharacterized protein n=1 Tax=Helianthus annuus TaxID=4232 RepID=A0A9K3IB73_HELAN|nr:hypothetical protein HanXRQr2_Chr08g0319161 [Helianthus annuus]
MKAQFNLYLCYFGGLGYEDIAPYKCVRFYYELTRVFFPPCVTSESVQLLWWYNICQVTVDGMVS